MASECGRLYQKIGLTFIFHFDQKIFKTLDKSATKTIFTIIMSQEKTISQFDSAISKCREVFRKKTNDYGTSWRVLRTSSLTDQLFIKAQRIKTIEQNQFQKVDEGVENEYIGLVNYAIIGLIQMDLTDAVAQELPAKDALAHYDTQVNTIKSLMQAKNHDYGEAWRDMRISSFTDLILMKLLRIRQIEDNNGKTLISEGIDAGYQDIVNYAIFALIKLEEKFTK